MILSGTTVRARVYPASVAPGEFGAEELIPGDPTTPGRVVYGVITRPAATSITAGGFDPNQQVQFRTREFPWPARTVVEVDGELWDVVTSPVTNGRTLLTRYTVVTLAARGRGAAAAPDGG